jgi:hypothetical protein
MTAPTDAANKVFEQAVDAFRKTADATLKAQKDFYQQWQNSFSGTIQPQTFWLEPFRQFQQTWSSTTLELLRKHRESLDQQYQAGIDAIEEAFRVSEADDPEEFRRRAEQLCRKNLDCLKEISEAQLSEFQEATAKWVDMLTKAQSSGNSQPDEEGGE